jgi:pyrroloquinoline quinone (PQQ) biosynthesis protein C
MNPTLRRTVPFLNTSVGDHQPRFQIDELLLPPGKVPSSELLIRLGTSLDLSRVTEALPADAVLEIVTEQYEAALNHAFSHPIWSKFRRGEGFVPLLGYIIENRHYLHAASSRMSPGVAISRADGELTDLLAEHLVEEADHAKYFETALTRFGCELPLIQSLRPGPMTLEWVYLMRSLSSYDPFSAAIASGFMEFSATDRKTVTAWHQMLTRSGLLEANVVEAFFGHVKEDMELEHGSNWSDAIKLCAPITPPHLQFCLNGVATIAEMLVRWSDSLDAGTTGLIIPVLTDVTLPHEHKLPTADFPFDGTPVWGADTLHEVTHGTDISERARQTVGLAFGLSGHALAKSIEAKSICEQATSLVNRLAVKATLDDVRSDAEGVLRAWHRSIDGHRIWTELLDSPPESLVYGWILENYHYLANSARHTSAAISACSDPLIRSSLVEHLKEEASHGKILKTALTRARENISFGSFRPLPTTLAFLGALRDVGYHDWKAYCLVLGFLQFSLEPGNAKHTGFYSGLKKSCPNSARLVEALQSHDLIDHERGHESSIREMLRTLTSRHQITEETLHRAAIVVQLTWSFLDGIRCHYRNGDLATVQRIGWFSES